ncbi:hypothetical protein [Chryseobacterium echinoideorum]|uniref:hypothetical protein n=1 Tax=Chryseobacterium echinoideorum TaxID=1549648 RepID=UPI001185E4EF|nr:hypothetical protein [Chryseobacterium echinoideorum]
MKLLIYALFLFIMSCQGINQNDVYGKYSPMSYKNTFDTLIIKKEGKYRRVVYDKMETKLLDYESTYSLEGNLINFDSFYFNLDKDLVAFPNDVKDVDMTFTTYFEEIDGNVSLCFGYHEGENCYKKNIVLDK